MLSEALRVSLRQAVEKGAALLDVRCPGWETTITERLELANCFYCILGQIYGEYTDGKRVVFGHDDMPPEEIYAHGFDAQGVEDIELEYLFLEQRWNHVIGIRLREEK